MGIGEIIREWWPIGLVLVQAVMLWAAWSMRKQFVSQEEFGRYKSDHATAHEALDDALAEGSREFTAIKAELEHLPTREDLDGIKDSLARVGASVAGLKEAVEGVRKALAGVQDNVQTLIGHELAEARQAKGARQ